MPSTAFFEKVISVINNGNIIGKPKMLIKVTLLLVCAAIAEIKVSEELKPSAPNTKANKNIDWFSTMLPIRRL